VYLCTFVYYKTPEYKTPEKKTPIDFLKISEEIFPT
jgi:hypothetical protein